MGCSHNCDSCSGGCGEPQSLLVAANECHASWSPHTDGPPGIPRAPLRACGRVCCVHLPRREQLQRTCMMQCIANVKQASGLYRDFSSCGRDGLSGQSQIRIARAPGRASIGRSHVRWHGGCIGSASWTRKHSGVDKQAVAATCTAHRAAFRVDRIVDTSARFRILVDP